MSNFLYLLGATSGIWFTAMSRGIDSPFGFIGRNTYFNLFDMFFLCNFSYGQKLQLFVDCLTLESILCVWLGGLRRSS